MNERTDEPDAGAPDRAASAVTIDAGAPREEGPALPEVLPALATGSSVLYPAIMVPYASVAAADVRAIDEATALPHRLIALFPQQPAGDGSFTGPLQPYGVAAAILRMARTPQGGVQAVLQGVARVRLVAVVQQEPYWRVRVERLAERLEPSTELEALTRNAQHLFQRLVALSESVPNELAQAVAGIDHPGNLADFITANLGFKPEERVAVLAAADITERLRLVHAYLAREVQVAEVGHKIRAQVQGEMDRRQREYILREQLAAIQRELGEEEHPELAELRRKLEAAGLPPEARAEADRELERLKLISQASPEYQVTRTYLEWLAELPWDRSTEEHIDLAEAERILDADHYGLERVKQRILDYLAVRKLRRDTRGPILCFVGPPGVGKTSLGQSIARATGRRFVRLALGGLRDEAEIRGHRRTYVGAMPGRIIQEIRRAGVNNPLIMLDEVDKLGADYRGDPAAALLEVLDPAQNATFRDHYLNLPFDLSKVLFITTANQLDPIPGPLRDRMEIIEIPGYTDREKLEIAKRYLLPRQVQENGLYPGQVEMPDDTILALIHGYTREAGVRNLERVIGAVCRRLARRVATTSPSPARGQDDGVPARFRVRPEDLPGLLDRQPLPEAVAAEQAEVGVATGMAATWAGGDILFIEAVAVPGKGQFSLTGQLGDVMQESGRAALTYARRRAPDFGVAATFFEKHDIHVHVPAGAVPKDGPSAGVTMATAIVSAVTGRPVRQDVAMTGELSLRGRVLPVGGIKEKVLAAHRAGIRTVILPKDNARDLDEVPEDLRREMSFVLTEHVDEVLRNALLAQPQRGRGRPRAEPMSAGRAHRATGPRQTGAGAAASGC